MSPVSRRTLLALAAPAVLAGTAACSDAAPAPAPASPGPAPPATTTPSAAPTYTGDAASVAVCAALAALAADLYGQAGARAAQGRYGVLPAALATFLGAAGAQQAEHARGWNALLTADGLPAVDGTPLAIEPGLRSRLEAARAPVDLAGLAVEVSATVTATVVATTGRVSDPGATGLAAVVAPVVAMQGATAGFLLGRPPTAPVDATAGALGPEALLE